MSLEETRETIAQINELIQKLTEDELKQLAAYIPRRIEELNREQVLAEKLVDVFQELREEGYLPVSTLPENPTAVDDYPAWGRGGDYLTGDLVSHNGRVWQSIRPGRNTATPGEGRAWTDVTGQAIIDPAPTPTGDNHHDTEAEGWAPNHSYLTGDHVMYSGAVYRVLRDLISAETPEFAPDDYMKLGSPKKEK